MTDTENIMDIEYCKQYDSYFYRKKDKWLHPKCKNKRCEYCKDRPKKPSEVNHEPKTKE